MTDKANAMNIAKIIDESQLNFHTYKAMQKFGGRFVSHLGSLFPYGDANNQKKLKDAFPEYFEKYKEIALHQIFEDGKEWYERITKI